MNSNTAVLNGAMRNRRSWTRFVLAFQAVKQARARRAALSRMDDHLLNDIGLGDVAALDRRINHFGWAVGPREDRATLVFLGR